MFAIKRCKIKFKLIGEKIYSNDSYISDFDYFYNMISSVKKDYLNTGKAAKEFLNVNLKEKFKVLERYISAANDSRAMISERTQDPDWFEGW